MGHVVFAAPSIERFHLHERLAKKLLSRGHRATVLCMDPVSFRCWSSHGLAAVLVGPKRASRHRVPVEEFAHQQCLLDGIGAPTEADVERRARPLRRLVDPLLAFFARETPRLVLLHQTRDGEHRLIHFLARELGASVLWTGDGLLPGTMQLDRQGLDGDSASCHRGAGDFRLESRRDELLQTALSSWLAQALPPPLARTPKRRSGAFARWRDLATAAVSGRLAAARAALRAWDRRDPEPPAAPETDSRLSGDFVGVLLQAEGCPRLRLDAASAPTTIELVHAASHAARTLDPTLRVVVVRPPLTERTDFSALATDRVVVVGEEHASTVATTASAVVTINHPLGIGALLAGTPVLHFGRTLYGVGGVALRTTLDTLPQDLQRALEHDNQTLRERFLCRALTRDHVWCSADFPDQNGLRGLVLAIEIALEEHGQEGGDLNYRPGPCWPLSNHRRNVSS